VGSALAGHSTLNSTRNNQEPKIHTLSHVTEVYYGIIYVPVIAEKAVPSEAGSGVQPSWVGQRSQVGEKSTR
jgi:hypothetical protein